MPEEHDDDPAGDTPEPSITRLTDPRWVAVRRFGMLLFMVDREDPAVIQIRVRVHGHKHDLQVDLREALSGVG